MEKKELIRALIALAEHEGSPIEFDVQFGHNGFVDPNGEFICVDGFKVSEICRRIANACKEEFV